MAFLSRITLIIFFFFSASQSWAAPTSPALEKAGKAIVRIKAESAGMVSGGSKAYLDPKTGKILVSRHVRPIHIQEDGQGILIHPSGIIACASHSVKNQNRLTVYLENGAVYPAVLLQIFSEYDLAFLKIESNQKFPAVQFGNSKKLKTGSDVRWFKKTDEKEELISGKVIRTGWKTRDKKAAVKVGNLISVDFLVRQGDSGGPILDLKGKVLGIILAGSKQKRSSFLLPEYIIRERLKESLAQKNKR